MLTSVVHEQLLVAKFWEAPPLLPGVAVLPPGLSAASAPSQQPVLSPLQTARACETSRSSRSLFSLTLWAYMNISKI